MRSDAHDSIFDALLIIGRTFSVLMCLALGSVLSTEFSEVSTIISIPWTCWFITQSNTSCWNKKTPKDISKSSDSSRGVCLSREHILHTVTRDSGFFHLVAPPWAVVPPPQGAEVRLGVGEVVALLKSLPWTGHRPVRRYHTATPTCKTGVG